MTALVHCDGPSCDESRDENVPARLCTVPWIHVEQGVDTADFHDVDCLHEWAFERKVEKVRRRSEDT